MTGAQMTSQTLQKKYTQFQKLHVLKKKSGTWREGEQETVWCLLKTLQTFAATTLKLAHRTKQNGQEKSSVTVCEWWGRSELDSKNKNMIKKFKKAIDTLWDSKNKYI